jgi:cob(I)alamin adenosyltransferase
VPKDDPRIEACGAIDEAVAAIGMARAELASMAPGGDLPALFGDMPDLLLRLQRELFAAGAELAVNPEARERLEDDTTRVSAAMVESLGRTLRTFESGVDLPREFVVPGATRLSAALEVARTVVRRAERRSIAAFRADPGSGSHLVPYLNRLADLLWILARAAEAGEAQVATPARREGSLARRSGHAHE